MYFLAALEKIELIHFEYLYKHTKMFKLCGQGTMQLLNPYLQYYHMSDVWSSR